MAFQQVEMTLNKREGDAGNKKFVELGKQNIFVPLLKDALKFIAEAEIAVDEKTKEPLYEDGLPVYVSDEANWLQAAIFSQVKAQARNKIEPGTANLKPDQKIAETWEELCAEGGRGPGAGLAILHEFRKEFAAWVKTLGLSDAASNTLASLVGNKNSLTVQPDDVKKKVEARITAFAESLDETKVERFKRPLEGVLEAVKPITAGALDF